MTKGQKSLIVLCVAALVGIIFFFMAFTIVNAGHRGVKVLFGETSEQVVNEGWNWHNPFASVKEINVQTIKFERESQVYTKDIQSASITYVLNYCLEPSAVPQLYKNVGLGYEAKELVPSIEGALKDAIGQWNAQDLIANREKATAEIVAMLKDKMAGRGYYIILNFQMTDINYSDVFEQAIENKVIAEQDALKAKNKTVQIQEEASQKVISANAEAESMRIRAKALESNPKLVEYEAVQKWNGQLPTYMMGNAPTPFINLK
ncbi:MAG: prohibitin family protein [Lactobacillaceae bacterium]|jgi:regulator of protease activity HflC (stomatin/prohibitin superfamily)|nr:prohibitin family protein [Lactobacillaceae bacterium]